MRIFDISVRDLILPAVIVLWLLLTLVVFPRLGIRT